MNQNELKARTKQFAIRIINFCDSLPHNRKGWTIGDQLTRCGTSVGANYRAACRAKTSPEFLHKIGVVEEEADESVFFLEMCEECDFGESTERKFLLKEANELTAIFTATSKSLENKKYSNA